MGVARTPAVRRRLLVAATADLRLDPIIVDTEDGATWDGLSLVARRNATPRRRLAVIVVHGSVGNYITGLPRRVSQGLAHAGFPVLSVNTRMANYGMFFGGGIFHHTPRDLDAWLDLARRMGYSRIVLLGYSLGASMVTYYQALRRRPEVVGLCTLAHPLSLPGSLRRRWERWGATPDYETVTARARAMLGDVPSPDDDAAEDEIFIVERAAGPTVNPEHAELWTYRTWWFSRGPEAHAAMSCEQIGAVRVPVALIQGADDTIVPPADGLALERIARGSGLPDVHHELISGANHSFSGREEPLVTRCVEWLDRLTI